MHLLILQKSLLCILIWKIKNIVKYQIYTLINPGTSLKVKWLIIYRNINKILTSHTKKQKNKLRARFPVVARVKKVSPRTSLLIIMLLFWQSQQVILITLQFRMVYCLVYTLYKHKLCIKDKISAPKGTLMHINKVTIKESFIQSKMLWLWNKVQAKIYNQISI